jgi:hypothetical protein
MRCFYIFYYMRYFKQIYFWNRPQRYSNFFSKIVSINWTSGPQFTVAQQHKCWNRGIPCDGTPCNPNNCICFGGIYRLHLHGRNVSWAICKKQTWIHALLMDWWFISWWNNFLFPQNQRETQMFWFQIGIPPMPIKYLPECCPNIILIYLPNCGVGSVSGMPRDNHASDAMLWMWPFP